MASPIDRGTVVGALFGLQELIGAADRLFFFNLSRSLNLSWPLNLSWSLSRSARVVPADNAASNRSHNSMTTSNVTCYPTDNSSPDAAHRLGTRDRR